MPDYIIPMKRVYGDFQKSHRLIPFALLVFISSLSVNGQNTFPRPDHIVVAFLENHAFTQIIDSAYAPFINSLATDENSALFNRSYGIEHPSQPNYLDFFSGSNQGVTDNNVPLLNPFKTPNLGRQLIDSMLTFITYAEDLPYEGYNGATYNQYVRKHNPGNKLDWCRIPIRFPGQQFNLSQHFHLQILTHYPQ